MAKLISGKKIASNVIISVAVQVVSLLVSLIANLFIPRFIDKTQYAWWQMFMLYQSYVGIMHFGLLDGMMLRYSQYDYSEIDKPLMRSQLRILLIFTSVITLIMSGITLLTMSNEYLIVFLFVAFSILTKNFFTYSSYTFQTTNRINKYAFLILLQRGIYGIVIVLLLAFGVNDFKWLCIAEFLGDIVSTVVMMFFNKEMFFGKGVKIKQSFKEVWKNVGSGIMLLIAGWSFLLIVGSARMIIERYWGHGAFADVSFSFSVSNLILTFATAISVVVFPSLKRVAKESLPTIFYNLRSSLSFILFGVLMLYYPGCVLLGWWIPKYQDSLIYLGMLLPIIVYSSRVNLITNTYLKVYRKEIFMAILNVCTIVVAIAWFVICAYVLNNITALLIGIVAVIMINQMIAEFVVAKIVGVKLYKNFIIEIIVTVGFIASAILFDYLIGFAIYFGLFAVYCLVNIKELKMVFKSFFKKKKGEQNVQLSEEDIQEIETEKEPEIAVQNGDNVKN